MEPIWEGGDCIYTGLDYDTIDMPASGRDIVLTVDNIQIKGFTPDALAKFREILDRWKEDNIDIGELMRWSNAFVNRFDVDNFTYDEIDRQQAKFDKWFNELK